MAIAKSNQELKREKRRERQISADKATNRYMINLSWGIVGIVVLRIIEAGFGSADTILQMPTIMKVFAVIFVLLAVALFACGKTGVLKNTQRSYNYALFSLVAAFLSAWIGYYAKIRLVIGKLIPFLYNIDSRWWFSWGPIIGIVVYLVLGLIWTAVRISQIEKGK